MTLGSKLSKILMSLFTLNQNRLNGRERRRNADAYRIFCPRFLCKHHETYRTEKYPDPCPFRSPRVFYHHWTFTCTGITQTDVGPSHFCNAAFAKAPLPPEIDPCPGTPIGVATRTYTRKANGMMERVMNPKCTEKRQRYTGGTTRTPDRPDSGWMLQEDYEKRCRSRSDAPIPIPLDEPGLIEYKGNIDRVKYEKGIIKLFMEKHQIDPATVQELKSSNDDDFGESTDDDDDDGVQSDHTENQSTTIETTSAPL